MRDQKTINSSMRILVVDDHKLFADGLGYVLRSISENTELKIVSDASSALCELDLISNFDLILLDLHMPGLDGLALLKSIKERRAYVPTVIVSATEDINLIAKAFELGAFGFVPKSFDSYELTNALKVVLDGDMFLPSELRKKVNRVNKAKNKDVGNLVKLLNQFGITKRQYEVLKLLANGYTNQQIASILFLSKHTVKSHVAALLGALQAENRTDCVRQGRINGLLS